MHKLPCPHCDHTALIRHSEQITRVTRKMKLVCQNEECGHTFVALVEAVRTLSPSATPSPEVHLPGPTCTPAHESAPRADA